jgi:hypothetical protein
MMKSTVLASISALFLLSLGMPRQAAAQTPGAATTGVYQFLLEDKFSKSVDFDARTDDKGFASGYITFTDQAPIPDSDDPEDPRFEGTAAELVIRASVEELTVEGNRALINATIVDSSHKTYLGARVQLVVEDNGANLRVPDRLTWTVCRPQGAGWVPSDAELDFDDGAYLRWWATDAERKDDVGIPSGNLLADAAKTCPVFPISSYVFADLTRADGDIIVSSKR